MILVTDKKIHQTEELDDASKNLPNNIKILTKHSPAKAFLLDYEDAQMDLMLIPATKDKETQVNNILYFNNGSLSWGCLPENISQENTDQFSEECEISFGKLPKKYCYLYVYLQKYNIKSFDKTAECIISILKDELSLFDYRYAPKDNFDSVCLGMFARNDTGWKFHPIFKTYSDTINDVIFREFKKYN